jgi:DNA-binding transcriptional regulator LsrR (DeoR family)
MFKQQSARIIETLIENPNLSSKEVADELGLNYNSVRGRISELKKSKVLEVNDKSEYTFIGTWWKKILKTGTTKDAAIGGNQSLWAYTFEVGQTEKPDQYEFLKRKIDNEFDIIIGRGGYDYQEVDYNEVEKIFIYPQFDIGSGVSFD